MGAEGEGRHDDLAMALGAGLLEGEEYGGSVWVWGLVACRRNIYRCS